MNNQISVYELYNTMRQREMKHVDLFASILDRCYARIRRCASVNRLECVYDVPEFIVGKPLYDINRCIKYVSKHLKVNGFLVDYVFPRYLVISWDIANRRKAVQQQEVSEAAFLPQTAYQGAVAHAGSPPLAQGMADQYEVQRPPVSDSVAAMAGMAGGGRPSETMDAFSRLQVQRSALILPLEPPAAARGRANQAQVHAHSRGRGNGSQGTPPQAPAFRSITEFRQSPRFSLRT